MKCHICDKEISDLEIVWNKETKSYEPCPVCLDIAFDAAFSNGFNRDEEDLLYVLDDEGEYTTSYFSVTEVGNAFGFDRGWDE